MLTLVANLHSTTRILNCEDAALFISTQLLHTINATPFGNGTLVAFKGLKSISLAVPIIKNEKRWF